MTSPLQTTMFNGVSQFYNGVATQSLRLDNSASSLLTRTPSAGNRKTWTWSAWIKRCDTGRDQDLFTAEGSGAQLFAIQIINSDKIQIYGVNAVLLLSNQLLRDLSAWYHIVVASDTTQGTATNRLKVYLNGSEVTSFATDNRATYAQNTDYGINSNVKHNIGSNQAGGNFGDYYIADVNFIDGQALTPTSFGETKNGVWLPIDTSGLTFGTQGFHLEFKQTGDGSSTASSSTIGADTANSNHYKDTNLDAYDSNMPDSPENNFCTMNPLHFRASYGMATLSEGNLAYGDTGLSSSWGAQFSTFNLNSGKWYAEVLTKGNSSCSVGVMNVGHYGYKKFLVQNPQNETGNWTLLMDGTETKTRLNGSLADPNYTAFNNDQVLGIALNADDKELSFYVDGTLQTGLGSSGVIDISTGGSVNDAWSFQAGTFNGSGVTFVWNFGQDSSFAGDETATSNADANGNGTFHTAPPSGYLAVCSANLPEVTIGPNSATQADDNFNTVLYTGNGVNSATGQDISGVGFKPDWLWIKRRNATASHNLRDSTRGVLKHLQSDGTGTEDTESDVGVTAFLDDGFRLLGTNAGTGQVNANNGTYVAWNWKANGGTTATNTEGSTQTTIQVNQTAGFSIITYTGNATAGATIGHGLGAVPKWILVKSRSLAVSWLNYHGEIASDPQTDAILLDTTGAVSDSALFWNDTAPSSTLITLGGAYNPVNGNNATYVAYAFAEIEGYSKFGSYTGNGVADGAFAFTGFRPAWLMIKRTDATGSWFMLDKVRDVDNEVLQDLIADGTGDETSNSNFLDFLSNGFKLRTTGTAVNAAGGTYIYMAFAEAPFKYANAR